MKHFPVSSFSEIFCLKSKDKVFVLINLLITLICISVDALTEKMLKKKIINIIDAFLIKIYL